MLFTNSRASLGYSAGHGFVKSEGNCFRYRRWRPWWRHYSQKEPVQPAMAKTLKRPLSAQVVLFQQNKVTELSEGETSHDNHW